MNRCLTTMSIWLCLSAAASCGTAVASELLDKLAGQRGASTRTGAESRIVHLPQDRSIGRAYIVEPQFDKKPLYHYALGWPNRMLAEARGDVNVPSGRIFRLDVWDSGPRAHRALAALDANDVQILNFYQCEKADDRMLSAALGLTGLKVLFLGQGRFTSNGLKHLAGFRELVALQLPASAPAESLDYLKGVTSLEYLNISGQELTDAKLEKIVQMPWLKQLSIAQLNDSHSLRHITNLKSLRYLNLQAVRDLGLDQNLAYISGLMELEEIDFEDSMIGDAGLAHLERMNKLRKLDLLSNPNTGRITDAGIAHLESLTALEDVRLPSECVTDSGMSRLTALSSLKKINLWSNHLTDSGMTVLQKMESLEDLDIRCQNLTDTGFAELCMCPSLKSLSINRCKISDGGLVYLEKLKSLEYFSLFHEPIKGDGLSVLKECSSLRELALYFLELDESRVTSAGVDRLKAAIPDISVTVPATMRSAGQRAPSSSTRRIAPGNSTDRTQTRRR